MDLKFFYIENIYNILTVQTKNKNIYIYPIIENHKHKRIIKHIVQHRFIYLSFKYICYVRLPQYYNHTQL